MNVNPIPFDFPHEIREILLVGVGGTGSHLARMLAMMIYHMQQQNLQAPQLVLIDDDLVETVNVGRQAFSHSDVGACKVEAIATRLNHAFGLDITWYANKYSIKQHFRHHGTLLIGAVDNHLARRELASTPTLWLDCGNHFNSGQVVLGSTSRRDQVRSHLTERRLDELRLLPNVAAVFPEMLDPEPNDAPEYHLSCADLILRNQQHILINTQIAAIAAQYVYRLLYRLPITQFTTFFSADGLSMRSLETTIPNLLCAIGETPPEPDPQPPKRQRRKKPAS